MGASHRKNLVGHMFKYGVFDKKKQHIITKLSSQMSNYTQQKVHLADQYDGPHLWLGAVPPVSFLRTAPNWTRATSFPEPLRSSSMSSMWMQLMLICRCLLPGAAGDDGGGDGATNGHVRHDIHVSAWSDPDEVPKLSAVCPYPDQLRARRHGLAHCHLAYYVRVRSLSSLPFLTVICSNNR